jgi:hypothetical protein
LEYNFTTRKKQYAGRKVSEVIKDMEFTVTHVIEIVSFRDYSDGKRKLTLLSLGIRQAGDKPSPIVDYYVEIRFKNCPLRDDLKKIFNTGDPDRKFTPELYDFIKDLEVSWLKANSYNLRIRKMYK